MLPSLYSSRCFVEAARYLNFRRAAKAVGLTPAAFGKRIRQLEEELDVSLFHRTTRSVELTPAGETYLPYAQELLKVADESVRAVRGRAEPAPIEVTIGTRHELGLSWILPMLGELERRLAHVTLHLYFGSGMDIEARVRSMEIECAVTSRPLTDARLDGVRLHREEYVFVGAPALLGRSAFESPEDACRHTLVDADDEQPLFRYWRDAPRGDGLRFGKFVKMGTIAAIRRLVIAGDGVAVLPRYLVQPDLDSGAVVTILPHVEPLSDHFRLVFRANDPHRAVYVTLARMMTESPLR